MVAKIKKEDLYNLDTTLAKLILPYVEAFRKKTTSHPLEFTEYQWEDTLKRIENGLKLVIKDDTKCLTKEEEIEMQISMELFGKWFTNLWW